MNTNSTNSTDFNTTINPAATSPVSPAIIESPSGTPHLVDAPVTTAAIRSASPDLLLSDVDRQVVKVRPMATPVDQIARLMPARSVRSMTVDYYSVDTKPFSATLRSNPILDDPDDESERPVYVISTSNDKLFAQSDTIMVQGVPASPNDNPSDRAAQPLIIYVVEGPSSASSGFKAILLNADSLPPRFSKGTTIVRMGRAAAELDVQTPQFEALPVKATNYCQIFKAQIEQSAGARLAAKEVGWSLSDQEEVAIMDMRLGMERSFLFGTKARITDPTRFDEVLFTQGIWSQAGKSFTLPATGISLTNLIDLMRDAFTGTSAGSNRKIFLAGSGLIQALSSIDHTKVISADQTITRWGIDFSELRSKFGTLYVVHSEVFDQCGHADDGLILDPAYLTKYVHIPFRVETLNLKASGVRNTDALVATEASCLVLRHPAAHVRVITDNTISNS